MTGPVGNSFLSEHHLDFTPRLDLAEFLRREASAALDISDGFLMDSRRLAEHSKVDLEIFVEKIPLRQGLLMTLRHVIYWEQGGDLLCQNIRPEKWQSSAMCR